MITDKRKLKTWVLGGKRINGKRWRRNAVNIFVRGPTL